MLYRLCKVFDQPNLVPILKEIELQLESVKGSPIRTFDSNLPAGVPPLSPRSPWSASDFNMNDSFMNSTMIRNHSDYSSIDQIVPGCKTTAVRSHIYDLEGPNFVYIPLFLRRPAREVSTAKNFFIYD